MEAWLEFARGPLFRFSIAVMILGLLRHFVMTILGLVKAYQHTGDKNVPLGKTTGKFLGWLVPFTHMKNKILYSIISVLFHIGLLTVPLFLFAHNQLWERGIGFSLPSIDQQYANVLTLTTIIGAILLFIMRTASRASRSLSHFQDYANLGLLCIIFASGYIAGHPQYNPFSYTLTMFIHVLSGNIFMILMPFTKIAHCVLFPLSQYVTEFGWRLVPNAGYNIAKALGEEDRPV